MYQLVIFSCLVISVVCEGPESRTVLLPQGSVRGYKDPVEDIFVFYSIPYATAPTGHDRYKAPLPPPVWTEPFEAVEKHVICSQIDSPNINLKTKVIQEDCLIANIYVPATTYTKLPVVVYVHGGGFFIGYGNMFTPKKLVSSKKVIAVTFNYRLGVNGFLCLGTKDVPGNAGMKDQVALLRWVKRNIAEFGGDPDEITIAGYSAGSSSVDLLMISNMTEGLFKRVIPESGASTGVYSIQFDPIENAKEYAKLLNFHNVEDFYVLENFYKTTPYEELNVPNVMDRENSNFLMSPCIERNMGQEMFLENNPVSVLKSGNFKKLPMLYGLSEMEGIFRMQLFDAWKDKMNENFSDFLPADLRFKDQEEREQVANLIKHFYFGDKLIGKETVLAYVDYFSDVFMSYPILRSIKLQVESGNNQIYLYEYSFVDNDTPLIPYTNIRGANHCAQTDAVSDSFGNEEFITEDFKNMKAVIREIWLNFIINGNPITPDSKLPEWPPVGSDWSPHMSINKTLELRGPLLKKRTLFWEEIYDKYYRLPSPPPAPPVKNNEL